MMNDETQPPSSNAASAANSDVERHNSKMAKKGCATRSWRPRRTKRSDHRPYGQGQGQIICGLWHDLPLYRLT